MLKRILTVALAALTLAAAFVLPSAGGEEEKTLAVDPMSPVSLENGAVFISPDTTASELLACFENKYDVSLNAADGTALSLTDTVYSGATVTCGEDSAAVVVPGDVNGDGAINTRDVILTMRAILGAPGAIEAAADVDRSGTLNSRDVLKIMRYIVGWNETFGPEREIAENDDPALGMYFTSSMLRIAREDTSVHGEPDGIVRTAKNEIEDAHIVVTSTEKKTGLTLDVGAIRNAAGDVLDREIRYGHYYDGVIWNDLNSRDFGNYTGGSYADPYPELRSSFDMGANESQSFIVKVKTTAGTAAGWYSAKVRVLDSSKNEIKKATLFVYVWNFAIDDADRSYTTFGMYSSEPAGYFGSMIDRKYYDGAVWAPYYKIWYDYCLENNFCPSELPYSITSSEADEYLDNPRVTSFIAQTGKDADCWDLDWTAANLRSIYDKLSQKQEWLDKALIYTVDEPWDQRGINWIKKQWNSAKAALGDIPFQTIVPYYSSWVPELGMDLTEALWDYCNCFCPDSRLFIESADHATRRKNRDKYPEWGYYMPDDQLEKYGQYEPRYEQLRERGDRMWWYICVTPEYPYANFFNTYQGAWSRVVLWQQYRYHSDGFLYWDLIVWDMGEHDSRKINLKRTNGGDGLLVYPGSLWYGDDPLPVPSIRFEVVRDGFEDYAYLRMLEDRLGRDAALGYSNRITTDMNHFTQDWRDIDGVRDELGFYLESLG